MRPVAASRARSAGDAAVLMSSMMSAAQPTVITKSNGVDQTSAAPNTATVPKPVAALCQASSASGGADNRKAAIAHLR